MQEFIVDGAWAFERYSFISTDTPIAGGKPFVSTGWGLVIYHRDADGKWRVARDAWGADQPATNDYQRNKPVEPGPLRDSARLMC